MTALQVERGAGTGPESEPEPVVPLRRNWRFQALWSGAAASMLGTMVADTAYPLMLLAMTGSPALAGAFGAVQFTASLLLGLHGGAVADRQNRRVILIVSDTVRALTTLSVPLALWLDRLTVPHVLAVAAVIGATTAYAGPVRMLAVRSVVPPSQLRAALTQDEIRVNGASLLGPPLAGLLLGVGRAVPFLAVAGGSLYALATSCLVRFDGRPAADGASPAGGLLDGLRELAGNRLMLAVLAVSGLINLAGTTCLMPIVVLLRDGGTDSTGIGLVLAGEAVGGLLGALLVRPLHRWFGPGVLTLLVSGMLVPVLLVPYVSAAPVVLFAALVLMALGIPALRVMLDLLVFQRVADELRGRVIAASMTVLMLGVPLGTFLGGVLLGHFQARTVLGSVAVLLAVTLLALAVPRLLRTAQWPTAG
ncbi:MFS transporter [Kitasatospora sp. NPDC096147]|uniref:MFS transporter n=1 Tax=Kitasatospora sp. NPDC096147 TaxID=3364093 RepID=UPI00381E7D3B